MWVYTGIPFLFKAIQFYCLGNAHLARATRYCSMDPFMHPTGWETPPEADTHQLVGPVGPERGTSMVILEHI